MADGRAPSQVQIDLATVKNDVKWIRETLTEANLVNRVSALERRQAYLAGAFAAVTAIVALAKALGLLG